MEEENDRTFIVNNATKDTSAESKHWRILPLANDSSGESKHWVESIVPLANDSSDESKHWVESIVPRFLYTELPIVYFLVGVALNAILIIYFIKSNKYKSPIFTILTSLAFMDLVTCLSGAGYAGFLMPVMTTDATFLCPLIVFLSNLGLVGSEYHLVFFAALRLYQMASPLSARARVTADLMAKICFMIVIVISIFMLAYCLHFSSATIAYRGKDVIICIFLGVDQAAKDNGFLATTVIIPCTAILVLHVSKHCVVSASKVSTDAHQERKNTDAHQERKNTDAKAVTIVIILFFLAWIPHSVIIVMLRAEIKLDDHLPLLTTYLLFSNSVMDPIVYCVAVKSVREDMRRVFCHMVLRHKLVT